MALPAARFGAHSSRRPQRPRRGRGLLAALVVLALVPVQTLAGTETDPDSDAAWEQFLDDRVELLETLAPPFVECFQRRDSLIDPLSPIFHGCLDWHSAVHAAYSHHALYEATDDPGYLELVNDQIEPLGVSLVAAEHGYQIAKDIDPVLGENPYGFGWFLVLAKERELSANRTDLREMADYAAERVVAWLQTQIDEGRARSFIMNAAHHNYSWSLLNLDVWARHTGDEALRQTVRDLSLPLLDAELDDSCPTYRDSDERAQGFQPVCLMRLAAAAHVWGDHLADWVAERLPADFEVWPVEEPRSCHAGGLNFQRAFALYQLHLVTGEDRHRDTSVNLIRYHVSRPDLYISPGYLDDPGYLCYSHWVAQLGVRAISLSYEERPSTPDEAPPLS